MLTLVVALLLGLLGTVLSVPVWIRWQQHRTLGQSIREVGPQAHLAKRGTPTAGGLCMLLVWLLGAALLVVMYPHLLTPAFGLAVGATVLLGAVGFTDDWLKMTRNDNSGVSGYLKLGAQALAGGAIGWWGWQHHGGATQVFGVTLVLGWLYPLFAAWVLAAFSNAVNLTDGVDGLAATTLSITFMVLAVLCMAMVLPGLAVLCLLAVGTLVGFWWFNRHPAKVFMGDTGSLAYGALVAAIGLLLGLEWWLLCFGLLFVLEAVSVVLQVGSFKLTGKRIFRMSPLHHHFELGGMKETQIVRLFMGIQLLGVLLGLALLPLLGV